MNRNIDKTDLGIRLIVGIGNPGSSYDNTRHNVGFYILDNLAQHYAASWKLESKWKAQIATIVIAGNKICLLKPQTFVNLSGEFPFLYDYLNKTIIQNEDMALHKMEKHRRYERLDYEDLFHVVYLQKEE